MEELTQELADVALELIDEYGADVTYERSVNGTYDPATSSSAPGTAPGSFKAIVEDLNGGEFAGNLVQTGDKKLTAPASYFANKPSNPDRVEFSEGWHTVLGCKAFRVGSTAIIFEIHARK